MKKKKIRNPLMKRVPKELRSDFRKYLVVSLFLILTIGFVSGMYVANGSMLQAANAGTEKYRLEYGHFELSEAASDTLIQAIETGEKADVKQYYLDKAREELDQKFEEEFADYKEMYPDAYKSAYEEAWNEIQDKIEETYAEAEEKYELNDPEFQPVPVHIYENFYKNVNEDHNCDGVSDGTVRVYVQTKEVNLACLMEGKLPEAEDEIAIDRMHADNAGIRVGDTVAVGEESYHVVGLIAYVNIRQCGKLISEQRIGLLERRQYHMFWTLKRMIDWCGEWKGKLYIGFIFSFFSHLFAAMPVMVAACTYRGSDRSGVVRIGIGIRAWSGNGQILRAGWCFHAGNADGNQKES